MNQIDQIPLIPDLPVTDPKVKKETPLQKAIIEIMNERGITDAMVIKETGIPWGTWMGWVYGDVESPIGGDNLRKLHKYFNVHVEYLLWGIGTDEPVYKEFETTPGESA